MISDLTTETARRSDDGHPSHAPVRSGPAERSGQSPPEPRKHTRPPVEAGRSNSPSPLRKFRSKLVGAAGGNQRNLVVFARQMSMLTGVGTGVVPALSAIAKQITAERWRNGLLDVRDHVEEGASLAAAMARHPELFSPVYCSMVAAGEATATLPATFGRLCDLARQQWETRNRVIGAAVYPAVLICICIAVISILVLFVLPRFETLFETLHVDVPASTARLMATSKFVKANGLIVGPIAAGAVVALVASLRSRAGRLFLDRAMIRIPMIGRLIKSLIVARICRLLGVMLSARVSLLESVELTHGATGNAEYRDLLARLKREITEGRPLAASMESSNLIDPSVIQAVAAGEQSGSMGRALLFVADWLDEENRSKVAALSKVFEPAVLVIMGLVVGGVAVSLFLPLFDMAAAAAG